MKQDTKRQNFNITPEQEAEIAWLQGAISAPTAKDAILRAVRVFAILKRETEKGKSVYLHGRGGESTRIIIPELEGEAGSEWTYLVERPHAWRRQLYVKGRRLLASTVWTEVTVNGLSTEAAADEWDLPVEAIDEIVRYCSANADLIRMEAEEERTRAIEAGVRLGA